MPNISRKHMPQVDTQNLSKAVDMVSDKVRVTKGKISVGKLKKSQKELHKDKIEGIAARFTSPDKFKPLIISKDNHIVDGHHRWGAAIHKWGTDVKIPIIRIHLPILKAIKLYKDVADSLNEVMSIDARRKLARKSKSKLKRGIKKRIKKMKKKRSNADLQKAAERKAKTILMQKMMKKSPSDMSMNDKMKFSQKLAKSPGKIQKVAKKILPKLKQAETERVKKMRDRNTQKNEAITIPIEIGDTVLGGKFKNKRIVVKSIDKNEKGDITINGKPLMKFRLVNEQIGYGIECKNCNHSWDIEPNDDRPYLCHNCGYDSQMQKIDMVGFKDWKSSLKEDVELDQWFNKAEPVDEGSDNLEMLQLMNKAMKAFPKSPKQKELIKKLNVLRVKNGMKPLAENVINEFGGIRFDLVGYDSNDKPALKKIVRASDDFMKDVVNYGSDKVFKSGKGVEYMEIYYDKHHLVTVKDSGRKIVKEKGWGKLPINEIPMDTLKDIDRVADKFLNPVDVVLTNQHFFDRLNDPRNGKEISGAELVGFFKRLGKKKKQFVDFLNQYNQIVAVDDRTSLNIPFMKQANKAIAKTVMRKKDFKTSNKKLDI